MPPKEEGKAPDRAGCSARSERLKKPALSYIGQLVKAMQEGVWDPETKKEGWIPLVVAENKLGAKLVLDRLEQVGGYPSAVMNYSGMKGTPECLAAMARLLERHLVRGHSSVDPSNLVIGSGCSALLDNLFWCICDEGDGILIPAPYYPAFDNDLQAKCGVQPLPFFLTEGEPGAEGAAAIRAQLDSATVAAAARGVAVRGLLVTNPNNPQGTIYRAESVREMLRWCLDNRMHYISDEVYALSVFKPQEGRFTSAITLAQELVPPPQQPPQRQRSRLATLFSRPKGGAGAAAASSSSTDNSESDSDDEPEVREKKRAARVARREARAAVAEAAKRRAEEAAAAAAKAASAEVVGVADGTAQYSQELVDTYVHLVYGLSKDWCASGLRLGVLYSRNRRLHQSLDPISVFAGVSNWAQWAVAQVLDDADWAAAFLRDNAQLLAASYDVLEAALKEEKIPFVPAVAGMFVWIDLRKWLPEPRTWEAERTLWQRVCDECKVILTPGHDCHAPEPGHFRLCFAWMPPAALKEAVQRLRSRVLEDEEGGDCALQ